MKTFEEIYKDSDLAESFSNLISQYNKVCDLIEDYYLSGIYSGILFESKKDDIQRLNESKSLEGTLRKEVQNLEYNISLVSKKIVKGYFNDIKIQRERLRNLLYNILAANTRFHQDDNNELKDLQKQMIENELSLKELVNIYNERARKNHKAILIDFDTELNLIKKSFIQNQMKALEDL